MKKTMILITILISVTLLLMACGGEAEQNTNDDQIKGNQDTEDRDNSEGNNDLNEEEAENVSKSEESESSEHSSNDISSKENNDVNEEYNASNNTAESEENHRLSQYSVKEIEYARIWLQLGANQDIDALNVEHISEGTPLNPEDETSLDYPEDVIQLSGTRLVDGVITYSGNGNGTINIYHVPKRWDGKNPAGEDVYKEIIENTKQESIDIGDDEKVEELIKIMQ